MGLVAKIAGGIFLLIAVYLIVASKGDFNTIITTISNQITQATKSLQGRSA